MTVTRRITCQFVAWLTSFCVLFLLFSATGCFWRQEGPEKPPFDPVQSASKAIEMYDDANRDGLLDAEELDRCPALKMSLPRADTDGDGCLTAEEIAERIRYFSGASTILNGSVEVTLNNQPLKGATVTFEPEPFMGDHIEPTSGITDKRGNTYLKGQDPKYPGIYLGFYKVRISKVVDGKETIPERYNDKTTLGYEATDDREGIMSVIQFQLTKP